MPKKDGPSSRWNDGMYIRIFLMIKDGMSTVKIAKELGLGNDLSHFTARKPYLREAIRMAEELRGNLHNEHIGGFKSHVYGRLPANLQRLWDRLDLCETAPTGEQRAEALLENAGEGARKHLFIYALSHSNFNQSEACRAVHITKKQLDQWIYEDPEFGDFIDELMWHKREFFDGALCQLAKEGDPTAIIFGNRCLNPNYQDKKTVNVNVNGQLAHLHAQVSIEELLPRLKLETRMEILATLRDLREEKKPAQLTYQPTQPALVKEVLPTEVVVEVAEVTED